MQKYKLEATKRPEKGRKVKNLRKSSVIPGTIYGRNVASQSISITQDDLYKVYAKAGNTGLIDLTIGPKAVPVLVHRIQRHPVTDAVLHVEFHQVDLKERVRAKIPLVLEGVSPAIEQKLGILLAVTDEVEAEALPTDLPDKITVNISNLTQTGSELRVSDLKIPKTVTILTPQNITVVKIGSIVVHEEEKKPEEATTTTGEEVTSEEKHPTEEKAEVKENAGAPKPKSSEKSTEK